MYNAVSPQEAVKVIKSGDNIWIHSAGAAPQVLIDAMTDRADELENICIFQLHTEGRAPYADPGMEKTFRVKAFFMGANIRECVNAGRGEFIPVFLSEVPKVIRSGRVKIDTALIQVSPPDKHGFCSLGISVDATRAAVEMASHVIAQINPKMPRTHGDGLIHLSKFDTFVEVDADLPEIAEHNLTEVEHAIGKNIASLVEDGATLQMGIGSIPDAALLYLTNHKDLGVHTEMFSDGLLKLVENGVVVGNKKKRHRDTVVTGFLLGSRKLYDFVDDNPFVRVLDIQYVNDTRVIAQNPKATSINSAIEVDITGQVCADSIGPKIFSGIGGQMDFIRGASQSEGGKPIIALPSTTKRGESKIVSFLKEAAGVVTTRAHVHYVVTEYGIADLYAKSLKERAKRMIDIAHPDHREALDKYAFARFGRSIY
ncbi:4-hydroxybutyrate CoA-transferase [bacterium]|nr:4-hydroxybutyrate CoA-transferase [bacterium]